MKKLLSLLTVTALLIGVGGCETATKRTDDAYDAGRKKIEEIASAAQTASGIEPGTNKVKTVYLGSKTVPFKAEAALPAVFETPREFRYQGMTFTLAEAVSIISRETNVPIRISYDVFGAKKSSSDSANATNDSQASQRQSSQQIALSGAQGSTPPTQSIRDPLDSITMMGTYKPKELLNQICASTGLNWEFRDGMAIVQRYMTKSFKLKVHPGSTTFETAAGKSGSSQTSSSGQNSGIQTGFTATARVVKNSGEVHAMNSAVAAVEKVLTPEGKVVPSVGSGTITVIDTAEGVRRAEAVIDNENEILTRNAKFRVTVFTFKETDDQQQDWNWNVVFQNFSRLGMTVTSPTTITNAQGGTLGLSLLSIPGTVHKFDGSNAFLNLLREYGKVHTVYDAVVPARNRTVTPISALSQKIYLAQTTPSTSTLGGTSAPGLTPGTITTGYDMQLQPDIFDSNQISLLFTLGVVDLVDIVPLTSGTGQNQQTIQGPETVGYQFQEEVFLSPGETVLLTGYERTLNSYTKRTLGAGAPVFAGGSLKGDLTSERVFVMIRPDVVGNAY